MLTAIAAISAADDRAFMEQLYIEHHKRMKHIALSYLHDPAAADDVTHDAVIALIGKIDLLRTLSPEKRRRYIFVATENTALKEIRCRGTREDRIRLGLEDLEEKLDGRAPDPVEILMAQESLDDIRRVLRQLSAADQLIIYYRCELGYSSAETAKEMGISDAASRQRFSRAHRRATAIMEVSQHE